MHMKPYGVVILVSIRLCAVSLAQSFYDHQADKQNTATRENEKQREAIKLSMRFLSTHPSTEKRIAEMKQRLAQHSATDWHQFGEAFPKLKHAVQNFVANSKQEPKGQE